MNENLKIAIYAICKNELQFVDQWFNSMFEADYICVLDTGSTDGTYEKLLEWKQKFPDKIIIGQKTYQQWRFDVARNDSMNLVPKDTDIFWCTDLDETLVKGWSRQLRKKWEPKATRGIYLFAWSHTDTGQPGRVFWYDKIHTKDYYWKFPVHETLIFNKNETENMVRISNEIMLHHHQDYTKSRSNYLDLLKLRAAENENDDYGKIYLMQEYFGQQKYEECINYIKTKLMPNLFNETDILFRPSIYFHLGACYYFTQRADEAITAYKIGISSFPKYRDNYMALAGLYLDMKAYNEAYEILKEMMEKTVHFNSWLERDFSWSYLPYQFLATCYRAFGLRHVAADYALLAYTLNPSEKLKQEYEEIKEEAQSLFKLEAINNSKML